MRVSRIARGAVVVIVAALLNADSPANAGTSYSTWCTDDWRQPGTDGSYFELNNAAGFVSVKYGTNPNDFSVNICYSDRRLGTPSHTVGGFIHLRFVRTTSDSYDVYTHCYYDPGVVVTTTCNTETRTYVTPAISTTPGTARLTISAWTNTILGSIGLTGATLNLTAPLFSCVWVNGVQQNPGCP